MKSIHFIIAIIVLQTSCSQEKKEAAIVEVQTKNIEAEETNELELTATQMRTAGIEMGMIALKNLKTSIRANGMLSVPNQNKAFITSVNSGVIRTLLIQPGSYVSRGQTVATIMNPDVAGLQQQLQTVNAQLTLAQLEYNRQTELVKGNAAPLKNVQRVQTEMATLKVSRNAIQKQLIAMGISVSAVNRGNIVTTMAVRSPISGTASNVMAQIGSPVDVSSPIAEIVNNSQLHLDLFVYEKDLPNLKANQTIHFTLTNNPGKEYDAQIYSIGTAFASATKTIPVHAVVKGDKSGLIEGMNITALISIGSAERPAVPNDAIVSHQGKDFIFVALADSIIKNNKGTLAEASREKTSEALFRFKRVGVLKGVSDVGFTEITLLEEFPPTAKVISKGAFFALAKMINIEEE